MVFNFGILAVLKYSDFTIANINSVFDLLKINKNIPVLGFILPLGISFIPFRPWAILSMYTGISIHMKRIYLNWPYSFPSFLN